MFLQFQVLLFTSVLVCLVTSNVDLPKVKTPLGGIKGYYKVSQYGRLYAAYEGVPYARPPVGKLRFEPPQPGKAWPGELQATKLPYKCLQYGHKPKWMPGDRVEGSEDCLYLNIYVPDREDENLEPLPVLFWIPGGAFMFGSANDFGERYILNKEVIFVVVNYRVGPLGFLSTEDDVVPGNMGLKDQSMALRWVHDNVEYFGGDPKRITLGGLSAGGASVHYHYMSPLSVGLFQRGVSMSGTALNCWSQTENALEKAKKLATLLGCPTNSTETLVNCLRYRPARSVIDAVDNFMGWLYNPFSPFGPVIEKSGEKPFINRPPIEILQSGDIYDVPWITSTSSEEGLYPASEYIDEEQFLKELNEEWNVKLPHILDYNYTLSIELHNETAAKIKKHYFNDDPISKQNIKDIVRMVGDRLFKADAEKAARMQAKANKSPVWFYYYNYRASKSVSDLFTRSKKNYGVSHADDAFLLFECRIIDQLSMMSENDEAMRNNLLYMYLSYVNDEMSLFERDFRLEWTKVSPSEDFPYLYISGPGDLKMASDKNFGDKNFWSTINFAENVLESNSLKDEL